MHFFRTEFLVRADFESLPEEPVHWYDISDALHPEPHLADPDGPRPGHHLPGGGVGMTKMIGIPVDRLSEAVKRLHLVSLTVGEDGTWEGIGDASHEARIKASSDGLLKSWRHLYIKEVDGQLDCKSWNNENVVTDQVKGLNPANLFDWLHERRID